ncbi:bifunctional riboflavin kinase/FAD synthetase [Amaricoccus sp.]|uniref:bifunctional riboflavin kinase/FAD synthetase n=1 Tax=Amaricoccus sp. TaxID=1872485 RepID=UPI001B70DAB7|nr:bifunctional riboflavin kinase/FAD synthetase [Amaricoccus sp.]MBP7241298.1 bifunctional riboflavin kinase/FAD synthetase [Amaricoccus sp.]
MRRHHGYRGIALTDQGAAVAIGNFDGVHRGHQAVLALARAEASALGAPFGVITFEPHPREFFRPDGPPFRLMRADTRARRLEALGVEQLYELPFDAAMAALPAEAFARDVLAGALGVRALIAGADFHFGHDRGGNLALLREMGPGLGFAVVGAPLLEADGDEVSSTAIRRALEAGRPEEAARLLGGWRRIEGVVEHGDARGRTLGFPTANLSFDRLHRPRSGVYAALVDVLDGPHRGRWPAAVSIGDRPTFGGGRVNLEAYLIGFDGDLYGAVISVALVEFLRRELRFDGAEPLVAQMRLDVEMVRERLAATLAC